MASASQRPGAAAPRALLAGGGTGGHVFPALAVGEELERRGWAVSYAGLASGLEARLVAERGGDFHPLPARPLLGRSPLVQLRGLATLGRSAFSARRLVRRLDARVVVGTGGYASAPAVVGARLARRPAFLVEPNARPGAANRWLSRLAGEAAVAFEETARALACPAVVTGAPVREAFFAVPELATEGGPPRLLALGGSQGARQINELLPRAVAALAPRLAGLSVLHQCGPAHLEAARRAWEEAEAPAAVEVVPFIDDVAAAMAASRLVVSRAGALTVAEICAAGRPAVLIPLAIAAGHQRDNARALAEAGAARVVEPEGATAEGLAELLGVLLADPARLAGMGRSARRLARPGAAAAIASRVERLARHPGAPGRREGEAP